MLMLMSHTSLHFFVFSFVLTCARVANDEKVTVCLFFFLVSTKQNSVDVYNRETVYIENFLFGLRTVGIRTFAFTKFLS